MGMRTMIKALRTTGTIFGLLLGVASSPLHADPPEATIMSPTAAITVAPNQTVSFAGTSSVEGLEGYTLNGFSWSFGDGATGAGAGTSHAYTSPGTYTAALTVTYTERWCDVMDYEGNCISYSTLAFTAKATRTITVQAPPTINSFSAGAATVGAGKPVTLSWSTTNASSLSLPGIGTVTGTSIVVYPTTATTYTLTASNAVGSTSASVTVTTYTVGVSISPGSASLKQGEMKAFSATVAPANQGVSWSATGGSLSGSTSTATAFTGTSSGTYTVKAASAEDPSKSASATVTVAAVSVATPVPLPITGQTFVGGTVSFSALVSGAVNTGVIWSVSGGGSISASGVFTASQQGTWVVTATSQADSMKSATAMVQVLPLTVTISPGTVTVRSGQTQAFIATVAGPGIPNQAATWSVVIAGGGTITPGGIYTAPATPGDYTVKATSVQDGSCVGTATIHVPGWVLKWKKDILYVGTKEVAEFDDQGMHVTLVDHLGSPRFVVNASGVVETEQKFLPFGESLADPASAAKFAKGFTNHEQTDPSGLIYMQARFYAPWYGRFLSPDPARDQHFEETQSWNIYSYVQNNPTMVLDPTGEAGFWAGVWNGITSAPGNMYRETKQAVMHPIQTARAMSQMSPGAQLKAGLSSSPLGGVIKAGEAVHAAVTQGSEAAGNVVGDHLARTGIEAATVLATEGAAKGLGSLNRTTEAVADAASGAGKVEKVLQGINDVGAKVEMNPLNSATLQEGNATIKLPDGRSVNVRVETHPIPGSNGQPVRHGNVDVLAPAKNKTVPIRQTHVTN